MELGRNYFPMLAPVWKAKIRKIAANFAEQSPENSQAPRLLLAEKRGFAGGVCIGFLLRICEKCFPLSPPSKQLYNYSGKSFNATLKCSFAYVAVRVLLP
jgi:hypothetical protein